MTINGDLEKSHRSITECTHFIGVIMGPSSFKRTSVLNGIIFLIFKLLPINSGMNISRLLSNSSRLTAHDSGILSLQPECYYFNCNMSRTHAHFFLSYYQDCSPYVLHLVPKVRTSVTVNLLLPRALNCGQ